MVQSTERMSIQARFVALKALVQALNRPLAKAKRNIREKIESLRRAEELPAPTQELMTSKGVYVSYCAQQLRAAREWLATLLRLKEERQRAVSWFRLDYRDDLQIREVIILVDEDRSMLMQCKTDSDRELKLRNIRKTGRNHRLREDGPTYAQCNGHHRFRMKRRKRTFAAADQVIEQHYAAENTGADTDIG